MEEVFPRGEQKQLDRCVEEIGAGYPHAHWPAGHAAQIGRRHITQVGGVTAGVIPLRWVGSQQGHITQVGGVTAGVISLTWVGSQQGSYHSGGRGFGRGHITRGMMDSSCARVDDVCIRSSLVWDYSMVIIASYMELQLWTFIKLIASYSVTK